MIERDFNLFLKGADFTRYVGSLVIKEYMPLEISRARVSPEVELLADR